MLSWSGLRLVALLCLVSPVGCYHGRQCSHKGPVDRILAPPESGAYENILPPSGVPEMIPSSTNEKPPNAPTVIPGASVAGSTLPSQTPPPLPNGAEVIALPPAQEVINTEGHHAVALTLPDAIATAFRQQPRLRVYLETVEQARRAEDIAFAPFLPMAAAGYSAGGYGLSVNGQTSPIGQLPGFTFLPTLGSLPIGLNISTGYELADVKLQWLICDFGRRLGRYHQAGLATDIASLQTQRAYQTVANEVSVAYYQVLRIRALRNIARDSVRRATEDLEVARNLAKGGVLEREKVLRAQVQLAESQRLLDVAEGGEVVAIAGLNLAIGLNVNTPTGIEERSDIPPFAPSLADCLQTAVAQRREFQVARRSVQVAEEGQRVARADFAPQVVADGALIDFQQGSPSARADLAVGFIKLQWGAFEGGKRVADVRAANSKIRSAMAQADTIADTIAFQVTETYRHLITARRGIDRSRPAVEQAAENNRLVKARARQGDATSAEVTDAESTLTRAQQDYLNSIHDYLIALARLEYAMGVAPTPASFSPYH
jgi:outer membrane protein